MAVGIAGPARAYPERVVIRDAERTYTWSEVNDIVNRAANALLATDLGPERRVAVVGANAAETVLAHAAGVLAGVSTVPVNPRLTADELAYIFKDSGAGMVFTGPE